MVVSHVHRLEALIDTSRSADFGKKTRRKCTERVGEFDAGGDGLLQQKKGLQFRIMTSLSTSPPKPKFKKKHVWTLKSHVPSFGLCWKPIGGIVAGFPSSEVKELSLESSPIVAAVEYV